VHEALDRCGDRRCLLALSVGNEVPGDIVRVHGPGAVEDVLSELVEEIHGSAPGVPATYCNYPTTEYLSIDAQDIACYNVFLEEESAFRSYLKRLHVATGDIPLLITELGLPSEVHGRDAQASALGWQLQAVDECGAAGAMVYAWTDEWGVAGEPVEGWGFGITDEARLPKPALEVVSDWAGRDLKGLRRSWPPVSVVVCAYNAEETLGQCLDSLTRCDYPELEVIVCDDGSTDETAAIARAFEGFRVLDLPHGGLSAARNAGIEASTADVVAFLDADAVAHPEWPFHLALALEDESVGAVGGPNLPMEDARFVERAIAASPGNPIHVLVTDDSAEHVPGCNMAFKKDALGAVHWFDPVYTAAGDDVDVCWKLLEKGYEIAFAAAAQIRHHRRNSVGGYLRQQRGYGKAERILWTRHPHRFNRLGQASWSGFIYGGPRLLARYLRPVVYHGLMGQAPFQGVVRRRSEIFMGWCQAFVPAATAIALVAGLLSVWLTPLRWLAAGALAALASFTVAVTLSVRVDASESHPIMHRLLVGGLHILQPLVRAWGRIRNRAGGARPPEPPSWNGDRIRWLMELRRQLVARRCAIRWASPHEAWDFEATMGPFVSYRVTTAIMWGWVPQHALRLSLRPSLLGAFLVAATVGWWAPAVGLAVALTSASVSAVEALALRRELAKSIEKTAGALQLERASAVDGTDGGGGA
jgi:glycosyltransferase involved in cell wall biosynthesis